MCDEDNRRVIIRSFLPSLSHRSSPRNSGPVGDEHHSHRPQKLGAAPIGGAERVRAVVRVRPHRLVRPVDRGTADQLGGGAGDLRSRERYSEGRRHIVVLIVVVVIVIVGCDRRQRCDTGEQQQ